METSNLIQEIEFFRSEIKNQQVDQNGSSNADLFGKIKQLLEKAEEVLKQDGDAKKDGDAKRLLKEIATMIKQLEENINAKFPTLTQMFEKWDKTLENVADGIKNLEKRLQRVEKDLKETKKDLKKMNDTLDFGQAAFLFEQDVAKYVLPEDMDAGKMNAYGNMIEWLNEEESEEKDGETEKEKAARIMAQEKAKERWEEVKEMVDWNREHEKVLKYMKRQRVNVAHPPDVDLEHVKYLVKSHLTLKKEKECCLDILTIIERLRLRKTGTQSRKREQPPRSCTTKKKKMS